MKMLRQNIDTFLGDKKLAIAGVSRNPRKFGNKVFRTLKGKGFSIFPINPHGGNIDGSICLKSLTELDHDVHNLLIVTHKRDTKRVLEEALSKGIKNIWIQNGCETAETIKMAQEKNINLVSKACILMYANPKGFHKFHQTISKWMGKYVKE
jgi:uncharacterized protein